MFLFKMALKLIGVRAFIHVRVLDYRMRNQFLRFSSEQQSIKLNYILYYLWLTLKAHALPCPLSDY